ncbi:MAG: succinyldiaminopimelate transaminase, partial [Methylophilaceae bacterium]|nr:succinyldiaminopimelate transaminase [Methylophilaceae bacterium]
RYSIVPPNADSEILPVNGSREALFAFAQAVINRKSSGVYVVCPNPFYQIYEGAALLAGAQPYFINTTIENGYQMMFDTVPSKVWQRTQLIYVCSPANPSGQVMDLSAWRSLFELAEQYGFVIAADECYSEIYLNDAMPPLGALEAARRLGRDYQRLVVFGSLSKRSNVPGMRSGFVAGDAQILDMFARYRTYHGCAMNPAVQAASIAAWNDEGHVIDNRRLYKEKFKRLIPMLQKVFSFTVPDATFYLWVKSSFADTELALRLYRDYHLTVLPGSFLAREAEGINPGKDFVRLALVASLEECVHAAERIVDTLS